MTLTDAAGFAVALGDAVLLSALAYADLGGNAALVKRADGTLAKANVGAALKPSSVSTVGHTHIIDDVDDLQSSLDAIDTALAGKAALVHASRHQDGGADEVATATAAANAIPKAGGGGTLATAWLPAATTSAKGTVELATDGEVAANVVVQGNDSRLSDDRIPLPHIHDASDIGTGTLDPSVLPLATALAYGAIKLAGDLSGTAASPALGTNVVSNAKLRQSAALTVVGNATNSTSNVADIAAGTSGHVLRRNGVTLGFGTLLAASFPAGIVDNTIIATMAARTVKVNATASTAAPTDLAFASDGDVLLRSGTTLTTAKVGPSNITGNSLTNATLATMAARTVKVNATASTAAPTDLAFANDGEVLVRSGTTLTTAKVAAANVTTNALTNATLAQMGAYTVKCNTSGSTANAADVNASTVPVLIVTGSTFAALGWRLSDLALGVWVL